MAQVTIVGGGPVGLGLAIELGQRDVEVLVLEKEAELHSIPKGQNLTQRTMKHSRRWAVEEDIRSARLMPPDYPAAGVQRMEVAVEWSCPLVVPSQPGWHVLLRRQ